VQIGRVGAISHGPGWASARVGPGPNGPNSCHRPTTQSAAMASRTNRASRRLCLAISTPSVVSRLERAP
jgi:hypothetical protein